MHTVEAFAWRILIVAIFSGGLVVCPTSMFGAPANVSDNGNYSCQTNAQTQQQNCTGTFTFPNSPPPGYVFCWPDPGVTGGCGSLISDLVIQVTSNRPLNAPPSSWNNSFTFNFNQYNASVGWVNNSPPYVSFYLIDKTGTTHSPPLVIFLDKGTLQQPFAAGWQYTFTK
jgi:hypothetical protein